MKKASPSAIVSQGLSVAWKARMLADKIASRGDLAAADRVRDAADAIERESARFKEAAP